MVGAGYFAQFHLEAWQRLEHVELHTIVESDQAKHGALTEQYPDVTITTDLLQADPQLDIVDIITLPATHRSQIDKALTHTDALIICQKPFCHSIEEAQQVIQQAKQKERTIVVHENFRFQPWYQQIKALLADNLLGDVQQATFRLRTGDGQGPQAYLERQPYFQKMPRFLIHETGVHFIDVFRYLFGEPDAVSADLRKLNPHIRGEDAGIFTLIYNSGLRAVFDGNRHLDHAANNTRLTLGELLLEGTQGTLALNGDGEISHREFGNKTFNPIPYQFNTTGFGADCVYQLQKHVVEHLLHGREVHNLAAEYLKNLQLESLVYQASETQRTLTTQG